MIEVKITGCTPDKLIKIVEQTTLNIQTGLEDLANETRYKMVSIIEQNKHREGSPGKLETAIQVEQIGEGSYGIGNIDFMSQPNVAPHWYLLNYGGMVSPSAQRVPGYFGDNGAPNASMAGTGIGSESFTYAPYSYLMIVKNPIAPVNYIEKTKDWLKNIAGEKFQGWTKSFRTTP